jgi:hypothetical protein
MTDDLAKDMEVFADNEAQKQLRSIKEIIKTEVQPNIDNATLKNIHAIFKKHYHIPNTNHIDVLLATALTYGMKGDPVWLIFFGASGDLKTSIVKSLLGLPHVILVDNITPNTLASGKANAHDLGSELQQSSNIIIIPDLATLVSKHVDEKNEIWGQLRTLYDGYINKKTGSGINKKYDGCHVTLIACATDLICDEVLVHAQLGTRDFMYNTGAESCDIDEKVNIAWDNVGKEKEIQQEIDTAINCFFTYHKIKEHPVPDDVKKFLKDQAKKLMILRAGGAVDRSTRELLNPVVPEVPTRLIKQFKKLYYGLKSLDDNYTDERCKEIISHIVNSSGNKVRQLVLSHLEKSNPLDQWFKLSDVQFSTRLSRGSVKQQLETLWNMGVIEKKIVEERIGGYLYKSEYGHEDLRGGHIEEVAYYRRQQI